MGALGIGTSGNMTADAAIYIKVLFVFGGVNLVVVRTR